MLCDSLHAYFSTQSWLITMLPSLIARRSPGGSGVRLYDGPDIKLFILVGWGRSFLSVAWPTEVQLVFFLLLRSKKVIVRPGMSIVGQLTQSVSPRF